MKYCRECDSKVTTGIWHNGILFCNTTCKFNYLASLAIQELEKEEQELD